jgi:hypothetical protein
MPILVLTKGRLLPLTVYVIHVARETDPFGVNHARRLLQSNHSRVLRGTSNLRVRVDARVFKKKRRPGAGLWQVAETGEKRAGKAAVE